MKRLFLVGACLSLFLLASCGEMAHSSPTRPRIASVCTETGLSGPALQENLLYCDTNAITGVVTNAAPSTYHQAIDLARKKHLIVGTPTSVSQTVDWTGRPITYVEFSSGFHAEHFNPSNGITRIYDQYDRQVYP
jgi:uncharacterized protein YkwD